MTTSASDVSDEVFAVLRAIGFDLPEEGGHDEAISALRRCMLIGPSKLDGLTLSETMYVAVQGLRCPFCLSDQLEGDEVDVDAGSAGQNVHCYGCGAEWEDLYTLTGYEITQMPRDIK